MPHMRAMKTVLSQPKSLKLNTSRQITPTLGIHRTNSNLTWRNKTPLKKVLASIEKLHEEYKNHLFIY